MNDQNLKPFVKGYDPRRNLKGVPRDALAMRKMLRKIGAELVKIKDEGGNDAEVTRLYARARLAFSSRNYKEFEMLLKALYPGLLKDEVDLTSGGLPIEPKADDAERFDRAILTLAHALRKSLPGESPEPDNGVVSTERTAVDGAPKPGG